MNQAREIIESLGGLVEGKAEDFAKKAAAQADKVKITSSRDGKFAKAEARGNRLTLGLTGAVDVTFDFEDNSDDLPGAVMVTKVYFQGANQSAQFTRTINQATNQRQFKNPLDFLKTVAKAI